MTIAARVAARFLAKVAEQLPPEDESGWEPGEKRGEWNLILYRNRPNRFDAFMKNPQGGGGGGNHYTSVKSAVGVEISRVGWGSPSINREGKNKVWVVVKEPAGEGWNVLKGWWVEVPAHLMAPPKPLSQKEHWDMATR